MKEISQLIPEFNTIKELAEKEFGTLSTFQLNWKPAADKWGIAECLDHLIVANTSYFPTMDSIIAGTHRNTMVEKYSPLTDWWGNYMLKNFGRRPLQKTTAPVAFRPTSSAFNKEIVNIFCEHQNNLKRRFAELEKQFNPGYVISSPAAGFITYRMDVALNLMVGHEYRHVEQAVRVKQAAGFPSE